MGCEKLPNLGFDELALADEVAPDLVVQLDLIIDRELSDDRLQHGSNRDVVLSDERRVVDVREETHQELAVESVSQAAVTGNAVTKVLDVEGTLETTSEETTEGSDQTGESSHDKRMELEGRPWERRDAVTHNGRKEG